MKLFLLIFSISLFIGCNSKKDQTVVVVDQSELDAKKITARDIENLKYTEYGLGADAKASVMAWQKYLELSTQLDFLKQGDLSFFNAENELLQPFLNDLQKEIPKSIASPSVVARLTVLETKMLKLHSHLKLSNIKKKDILQSIKEVFISFSNLNLQINKKFELESQKIQNPSETKN